MSSLSVRDLSIHFGGIKALANVSFEVPSGRFVGLLGPNGAGKTTVINCISRIYRPQSGAIFFDGQDLLKLRGDQILGLGIARTFQDLSFFNRISDMSILDYLKLGQFNSQMNSLWREGLQTPSSLLKERELKRRAHRVLEFFREFRERLEVSEEERGYPYLHGREGFPDLLDIEHRPISTLSFAWRRRLDLARALVSNPRLLLLDEPTQGLPPSEIENLGKTLKLIQAELGVSALIVEHNVSTLAKISDRLIALNLGEKLAEGSPEEVTSDPKVIEVYLGAPKAVSKDSIPAAVKSTSAPAPEPKPLLEARAMDLYYGSAQALFSVSIRVFPRQIVSVIGTNGSGKSTLLRALSGVEKPSFGEILFNGEPMPLGWPEIAVEAGIQYVPQGHIVFPELTVLDNLRIGTYMNRGKASIEESLERVFDYFPSLRDCLKVQAAGLSGGQQQMLAIGQALIARPKVLLLDEPSLGLSPIMVNTLFEIVQRISQTEDCAVILVEQNVNKALEFSDYVYMLSSGVLIGQGSSHQFIQSDSLVRKYLGFT